MDILKSNKIKDIFDKLSTNCQFPVKTGTIAFMGEREADVVKIGDETSGFLYISYMSKYYHQDVPYPMGLLVSDTEPLFRKSEESMPERTLDQYGGFVLTLDGERGEDIKVKLCGKNGAYQSTCLLEEMPMNRPVTISIACAVALQGIRAVL